MLTICLIRKERIVLLSPSSSVTTNFLLETGDESSAASGFLFSPDGGELMDLLAVGEDTGSDLVDKLFAVKICISRPSVR